MQRRTLYLVVAIVVAIASCSRSRTSTRVDQGLPDNSSSDQGGDATAANSQLADGGLPACSWVDDADCAVCGDNGMLAPMPPCSAEQPCTNLLSTYTNAMITDPPLTVIDTPTFVPDCETSVRGIDAGRTSHDDGPPIEWTDADGTTRYHCEYRPPGTATDSKRPLLLVVHGSGGYAYSVYDTMSYRDKAATYDLSGDAARPGFIIVAPQARNLHWPTSSAQDGSKHDTFFRDLASPSDNRDVAYYDHLIDSLVSEGVVDPDRIYITGWSNGARFAALYGIARHDTTTPGGNRIAAVANYSGGDPFSNTSHEQSPSCQATTYPTSDVPLMLVSRACDVVACDADQDAALRDDGVETSPGNIAEDWIATLRDVIGNPNVVWLLIAGTGAPLAEGQCTGALCGITVALINHVRWPDSFGSSNGVDYEPTMLDFLRDNPR